MYIKLNIRDQEAGEEIIRKRFNPEQIIRASFSRRHLKSSSPQRPLEDMETISIIFQESAIGFEFGKIFAIMNVASPQHTQAYMG
jgi:hypothetical protein